MCRWDEEKVQHGYADLGEVRLHYVEAGEGPLVVLVHGFPEFWYSWRHQILPLAAAGFRVVAPDTRGTNLSTKPAAIAAYWAAMLHPERIDRLAVLNVPHPVVFAGTRLRLSYQLIRATLIAPGLYESRFSPASMRATFRRELVESGSMGEEELDRFAEVVIYGAEDPYMGPELAAPPAEWVSDARVELIPGANHRVQMDRPAQVTRLLEEFMTTPAAEPALA